MQAFPLAPTRATPFFDVARNWELLAALLSDPTISIQWIFVASPIRATLLAYAEQHAPALVARAARVLAQPSDSSPHANHFHIRIYCTLDDRLAGCLDAPPFHPFAPDHSHALRAWLDGLLPFLAHPHAPETRLAIEHIVRMNATDALAPLEALRDRLAAAPDDPLTAELAPLARDAIAFLRGQRTRSSWLRWRATAVGE